MFRLIISVFFLVILAVLIVFNIGYSASFNFYGQEMVDIPVLTIALLSFILGVVYSFIFYLIYYFNKKRKNKIKAKSLEIKDGAQEPDGKKSGNKITP